jgi:Mn-containing catalase
VDAAREAAHVQTFDEAMKICAVGSDKRRVMVLNMPENSMVAYVHDEGRKQNFWMSIIHLDKAR